MFDLGWTELLVIGIVALIVVGPKDLPVLFRNIGRFMGKARGMAREFSRAMNEAAEESGINEVAKGLKTATNPVSSAMDGVKDAAREMTNAVNPSRLDPSKFDEKSETGKLAAKRARDAEKIHAATKRAAAERRLKEATEELERARAEEAAAKEEPEAKT